MWNRNRDFATFVIASLFLVASPGTTSRCAHLQRTVYNCKFSRKNVSTFPISHPIEFQVKFNNLAWFSEATNNPKAIYPTDGAFTLTQMFLIGLNKSLMGERLPGVCVGVCVYVPCLCCVCGCVCTHTSTHSHMLVRLTMRELSGVHTRCAVIKKKIFELTAKEPGTHSAVAPWSGEGWTASSLLGLSARATGPRSHGEQQASSWWSRLMGRRRPLIDWKQLCAEPSTESQSNLPLLPCSLAQSQPLFFRAGEKYLFICSSTSFSHPWPLLACDSVSFKTWHLSASQRKLTLQNTAWPHLLITHQTSESGVHLSKLGVYCWFTEHVLPSAWQPRGAAVLWL